MSTNLIDLTAGTKITLGTNSDTYTMTLKNKGAVYQQSPKIDFGATWSVEYAAVLLTKFQSAPTAGLTCDIWMGYSDNASSGLNNWANCGGLDGPYTGYTADAAAAVYQLDRIGSLRLCNVAVAQEGIVGSFTPRMRYGYIVWYNGSGQTLTNTDADHQVQLHPVNSRIEASV